MRTNQARRPVGHGEERVGQAAAFEILEEGRAAGRVLLRARRQVQENLPTVLGDAPGAEHRLAGQPGVQTLGDAIDEEVGGGKFTEVAARLVFQQVSDFTAAAAGHSTLKSAEYTVV